MAVKGKDSLALRAVRKNREVRTRADGDLACGVRSFAADCRVAGTGVTLAAASRWASSAAVGQVLALALGPEGDLARVGAGVGGRAAHGRPANSVGALEAERSAFPRADHLVLCGRRHSGLAVDEDGAGLVAARPEIFFWRPNDVIVGAVVPAHHAEMRLRERAAFV